MPSQVHAIKDGKTMLEPTDDIRIRDSRPLLTPALLVEEQPALPEVRSIVANARREIAASLHGRSDRLVVIVGPCSLHDPDAGLEYAHRLRRLAQIHHRELCVIMRVYFEKPRTIVGWKGLINDPHLDGSHAVNDGLRIARRVLLAVGQQGLASGTEFLDPITPQYLADLVSWAAIGARTVESQVHRELASGLSMPVGFKNGTGGNIQIAIDAVRSSGHPHRFLSVTKAGFASIISTTGNPECHVVLRGGTSGPNYTHEHVSGAATALDASHVPSRLMIDCSHSNSGKSHERQFEVAQDVADQIANGGPIFGVMLESFLVEGRQDYREGKSLVFGQSITDACVGWEQTEELLSRLAEAVRVRQRRS